VALRLGFDVSIQRHPYGGTARYAEELLLAMRGKALPGDQLFAYRGWRRLARGHRWLRFANLAADLSWLGLGIPALALRDRLNVWYSPSNILPPLLPRPAVVTIHDVNFLLQPEAYERGYVRYATAMVGRSARRACRVITDSEFSRRQLIRAFRVPDEKVSVVYPGLDHALTRRAAPESVPGLPARYALYVGQTEPHKNAGLLLDAWQFAPPADLALVIAGQPGRDHRAIVDRAGRSPLAGSVSVLGRVTAGQLETLYAGASCFLLPSRAEGFGFPALEAMARGIPVAVARAGSLPEVTAGAALTFDPDDASELAARVAEMVGDGEPRAAQVAKGREVAARYSWSAAADSVWAIIRDAAPPAAGSPDRSFS
jgi:glycosyltransferase involved in cell wall biosynthesis